MSKAEFGMSWEVRALGCSAEASLRPAGCPSPFKMSLFDADGHLGPLLFSSRLLSEQPQSPPYPVGSREVRSGSILSSPRRRAGGSGRNGQAGGARLKVTTSAKSAVNRVHLVKFNNLISVCRSPGVICSAFNSLEV